MNHPNNSQQPNHNPQDPRRNGAPPYGAPYYPAAHPNNTHPQYPGGVPGNPPPGVNRNIPGSVPGSAGFQSPGGTPPAPYRNGSPGAPPGSRGTTPTGGPANSGAASDVMKRLKVDFPDVPEKMLSVAVRTRKTYDASLRWLNTMKQRNLMPPPPAQNAMPAAQEKKPKPTIRQKFSHLAYQAPNQAPQQQMPMQQMRFQTPQQQMQGYPPQMQGYPPAMQGYPPAMQGYPPQMQGYPPQMQGFPPQMQPPFGQPSPSQAAPLAMQTPRRNADEDDFSDEETDDSDAYDPQEAAQFEARLLEFLNTATPEAIADVSTQPMESVQALVKKRPFVSLAQAGRVDVAPDPKDAEQTETGKRRRGAAKKAAGLKIIDAARTTLRGYEAVDSLIKECSRLGKVVQRGINAWQLNEETLEPQGGTFFKEQPKLLSEGTELKNYQQVGINWLSLLYKDKLSCILADEMGLGKTLQVIAFLAHLKETGEPGPHLVVCPASTLENWLRELSKFCPSLRVEAYYGGQPERQEIRDAIFNNPDSFDVMVTTYNLATGLKQDAGFLKSMGFNVVVYDEGHLLKNSQSERYNKLMKLKAKFRVLLTGTPLQNNLRELVSLLSFILPRLFTENRDDLLEVFKYKAKATTDESEKSRDDLLSEQRISKAKTMMQPFVMRRRKEQVLAHLPPKTHEVRFCDMTDNQRTIYEREMMRNKKGLRTATDQVSKEEAQKGPKKQQKEAGKQLDNVLMQLRKAALHPLLFREIYTDEKLRQMAKDIMNEEVYKAANETYIFEDMQVMNDFELDRLCRQFPVSLGEYVLDEEHFYDSGKVKDMVSMVKPMVEKGDRILIFSQFTQVLDILQKILSLLNIEYLRMDGQTPVEARQDMIDQFHENDNLGVFLLSTKAGGFGINLAVANTVIVFDLSFNPHDDKQAEDRAHRVGQKRPVKVYRMITKKTIEENILELANTKLALDKQVSEDNNLDGEDNIDTEKEAYVAGRLLGINHAQGNEIEDDEDEEENNGNGADDEKKDIKTEQPAANSTLGVAPSAPAPVPARRGRKPRAHDSDSESDDDDHGDYDEEDEDEEEEADYDEEDDDDLSPPQKRPRRAARGAQQTQRRSRRAQF